MKYNLLKIYSLWKYVFTVIFLILIYLERSPSQGPHATTEL